MLGLGRAELFDSIFYSAQEIDVGSPVWKNRTRILGGNRKEIRAWAIMMEASSQSRSASSYTSRLDPTLKALQDRVKEQEAVLEKVRLSVSNFIS
jgi:hypothetical protein